MKQSIFSNNLFREHLQYYRFLILIVAICFPIVGLLTNYFDNTINDPIYLRLILCFLTLGVFIGTFFKKFRNHFHVYFNTLLIMIVLWSGFLTLKNNFSFSTTFFYITAISIVSFALRNYKEVAIFSIISLIATIVFLKFSNIIAINRLALVVSIFFIQLVAFFVIKSKKQSEIKLQKYADELQKLNADKDKFISILAHDLKNPFNTLLGFSDLLLKNLHKYDIPKIEKHIKLINVTTHQTYELLEQLLMWAKSQSGKWTLELQQFEFLNVCNEIINTFENQANEKSIKLNSFEPEKIILTADLNMFKTVVRNLISNAIKFSNQNGQVNIFAEKKHSHSIITVSDNGVGIEKNVIHKLWELNSKYSTEGTNNEKGTGFGLMLCKELIEKHGGQIWVESEVGKGSDFKFTLPTINN